MKVYALAAILPLLAVIPILAWQQVLISKQSASVRAAHKQAYEAGAVAFSEGVSRSSYSGEHWQAWTEGFDDAAETARKKETEARLAEEQKREELERAQARQQQQIALLQQRAEVYRKCETHLEANYRKSAKYDSRLADIYYLHQLEMGADDPWERSMQRKLGMGVLTAIEMDEHESVKHILADYNLHSFEDWRELKNSAESNGW